MMVAIATLLFTEEIRQTIERDGCIDDVLWDRVVCFPRRGVQVERSAKSVHDGRRARCPSPVVARPKNAAAWKGFWARLKNVRRGGQAAGQRRKKHERAAARRKPGEGPVVGRMKRAKVVRELSES